MAKAHDSKSMGRNVEQLILERFGIKRTFPYGILTRQKRNDGMFSLGMKKMKTRKS